MTGEQVAEFTEEAKKDKSAAAVMVLAFSAVDEAGQRLFSKADVSQLKKKSLKAIMRAQKEAMKLNGLDDETQAATKND